MNAGFACIDKLGPEFGAKTEHKIHLPSLIVCVLVLTTCRQVKPTHYLNNYFQFCCVSC